MPDQQLINNIRELNKELKELNTQITLHERKLSRRGNQNTYDVEELRKQLEDLKRRKNEIQKEKNCLQEVVKLQGALENREKRIKESEKQIKKLEKEKEKLEEINDEEIGKLKEEIAELKRTVTDLKSEIQELKQKIEERDNCMLQLEKEMKENEHNHKNRMKEITAKHEEEIKDLRYKTSAKIQEQEKIHSREMNEIRESNEFLEHEANHLKASHSKMENDLNNYKKYVSYCSEENQPILYLGQIFSDLQTNWYRYVMPTRCHAEQLAYKVKDIEDDIEDRDLLTEKEQEEAQRRWEELQDEIEWKKNQRLMKGIKRLRAERNRKAHPKALSAAGAKSAAEKLRDQGILKVKPSFDDVLILIKLWESSMSL